MMAKTTVPTSSDPDVRVPSHVEAQALRAEELMRQMTEQPAEEAPAEAAPEQSADTSFEQPAAEVTQKGNEQPAPPPPQPDDASWERKYHSMKGRFDQSTDTIRQLQQQISDMRALIADMRAAPPPPPPPPVSSDQSFDISPKEVEEYGEDFLKVVGKKARAELAPVVQAITSKYEQKIAELEGKLSGVTGHVVKSAKEQMYASLDQSVPQWRSINKSDDFIGWLQLQDPYSGAIRHEMLKEAYARNDTKRVAAFFNGFLADEAATRPAGVSSPPPAPEPAPAKMDLKDLAAPGRAKSAAGNSAPAEKPIFTRAEIAAFYADQVQGKFRGRDADAARIEQQIWEAQREGRIR